MLQVDQIITINIHGLGSGGEGVGYCDGFVVFVDGALPGEKIKARLTECHKRHGWASLLEIIEPSKDRVKPPCKYFGTCGGCQIMHLAYPKQLEVKRQRVVDAIKRIGKLENCNIAPCVPSPAPLAYRNKIQLPVKEGRFGLYARNSHDLIEIDHCMIHCALGEKVFKQISSMTKGFDLRHLLIKSSEKTNEALVIFVTEQEPTASLTKLAEEIKTSIPEVKGVIHNLHSGQGNVILGKHYKVLAGAGHITERLGNYQFKVSPASFFQVNPAQAEQLYAKALEFAALQGDETVLDAYCGVGTLSLFFAANAKNVIGVECVPEAIQDAKDNAKLNQIHNVSFVCAQAENYISTLKDVDLILLNPPRKGCEISFLEGIQKLSPPKLIYISCDPATLARDLAYLKNYRVEEIQPFDMFPQTAHVECVTKLVKI